VDRFPSSEARGRYWPDGTAETVAQDGQGSDVVLLAPLGRDAALAEAILREAGLARRVTACLGVGDLVAALDDETGFAMATEEALRHADLRALAALVEAQPPWSDLPFIIMTGRGGGADGNPAAARLSRLLHNVTFIERPFHPTTFVSLARAALRGRARQYEARTRLEALHDSERQLRQANDLLEQRVHQRTAELRAAHAKVLEEMAQRELAEGQLRQSLKVEAMGQITGGVAHDFNNLLLAVLANLDLLRGQLAADAAAQPLIEGAMQAAQRGAALTQRLLAFARRQSLKVAPVEMARLVRGMLELLQQSLGPGIDLTLELADDLPPAMVDQNQMELALLNLVVNARDAMPQGGRVTIGLDLAAAGADCAPGPAPHLRLAVTDTGQGMDAATLARAVDPFFSTKGPGKGTGLGLSMIDGLARQLHGELRLSSHPGQGTRAELWLPVADATAEPEPPGPPPTAPVETPPLTVLLVEDETIIAMATRAMLVKLGHKVIDARSGAKALQVIEAGTPVDLMLTDFSMPQMTGLQLAERVRALRPHLPILLATGYMTLPEGSRLELPMLLKPYMRDQLRDAIAGVMAGSVQALVREGEIAEAGR